MLAFERGGPSRPLGPPEYNSWATSSLVSFLESTRFPVCKRTTRFQDSKTAYPVCWQSEPQMRGRGKEGVKICWELSTEQGEPPFTPQLFPVPNRWTTFSPIGRIFPSYTYCHISYIQSNVYPPLWEEEIRATAASWSGNSERKWSVRKEDCVLDDN